MIKKSQRILLYAASLILVCSCARTENPDLFEANLNRVGGIQLNDNIDQIRSVVMNLQGNANSDIVYGIDFSERLPYRLSLETGEVQFLSSSGAGPEELRLPSQLTLNHESEFYVYDTSLDVVARFADDKIVEKIAGFLRHNVWLRNPKGYYWNNHIITSIKDPDKVTALDFENAKPLAFLSLSDSTVTKHGKFSPTADKLDLYNKYPMIALSQEEGAVYYVFYTDYSVMKFDIERDTAFVASSYKPQKMRERTVPIDPNNPDRFGMARVYGLDTSQVADIEIIKGQLIVIWYNATDRYYDDQNYSPEHLDHFGVVYDLPDLTNPREFTLPGKFLGTWGNRLLIEENDDVMEYTIGFYEFAESVP